MAEDDSRVDFDMPDARVTKEDLTEALMELVDADHPVFTRWITDAELAANPGLVKSKNVRPPTGTGRIRLVCIGENAAIDSQPCGGTHVAPNRRGRRDPYRQDREEGPREPSVSPALRQDAGVMMPAAVKEQARGRGGSGPQ